MAGKKSLVIVESPAKATTINKYLGKDYVVKASLGHVKDLPKSKLGVDPENDFQPVYEQIKGKEKVIKELKTAAKSASRILLAADPDREGEAICQHLKEILDDDKVEIFRVLFNEITPKAIKFAVENPGRINQKVANDALNRMEVDTYGLDEMDRKLLLTIIEKFNGGPVGLGTISASIHEEKDSIEEIIEPYLIQIGFLDRTPRGRLATPRAYEHFGIKTFGSKVPSLFDPR